MYKYKDYAYLRPSDEQKLVGKKCTFEYTCSIYSEFKRMWKKTMIKILWFDLCIYT